MKFTSTAALLAGALSLCAGLVGGCASDDLTQFPSASVSDDTGSVKLALQVGNQAISSVTAVIEGKNFDTQTHQIDVTGDSSVISIFFGNLPVAKHYKITLTAGECSGSASFNVTANEVALVSVPLSCGVDTNSDSTGGVQVTGTITGAASSQDCDSVLKIVAAPSIQNGTGPISDVHVFLNSGVSPTAIAWTTSSTNGGSGTVAGLAGTTDPDVSFDCSTNGTVFVVANVTAPGEHGKSCTEQARVSIICENQVTGPVVPSVCGNGIIEKPPQFSGVNEVCDTNGAGPDVLPQGTPVGSTCNASCTAVVPPTAQASVCGNGVIEPNPPFTGINEACDTNGNGPDVLPTGTAVGSTCNATCTAIIPPVGGHCGNGVLDTGEACDGSLFPGGTPAGSTCNSTCTALLAVCGNGIIEHVPPYSGTNEVCDRTSSGPVLPLGTATGSTCSTDCTAIVPPSAPASVCGNNVIETNPSHSGLNEVCDGTALPSGAATGSTCNSTCTAVIPPGTVGGGHCLTCAQTSCKLPYDNALGASSDAANLAAVTSVLSCLIGDGFTDGRAIPQTSCFFKDLVQPGGSLVPCYCGNTPQATCLATGPANHTEACGVQIENASGCSPLSASCVTQNGSNPAFALGDVTQLLNCERAACQAECGFPAPPPE